MNTAPGPGVRLAARMVAAVDVGDGPAEGEAEAGAVAFGRHEGLEDGLAHGLGDAGAAVGHLQDNRGTPGGAAPGAVGDADLALVGDGLARVRQ